MIRGRFFPQTPSRSAGEGSRRFRTLLLATALATALGGWGGTASAQSPGAAPSTIPGAAFPVVLTDDEGTSVTLDAAPERVISLSPAITETVFALGAGDRLVGGTDFDDYPAEAVALPDVATFNGVLMEQIVALRPDLVIAAGNNFTPPPDIARMRELGYPVLVVYAESVDEVLTDIDLIGDAVGVGAAARAMADDLRVRLADVEAAASVTGISPRTFYEIGSEPELYGPAPNSFIADLVVLAGGDPILTVDPSVFSISVERLITADPEVIVVGDAQYGVCPDQVIARPGWSGMTAVVKGDVRPVNDTIVTRPGPRIADGLASLARAIHPDIVLSGFAPDPPLCPAS